MAGDKRSSGKRVLESERLLEESREAVSYYQKIAEDSGRRRLREINQLSELISERKLGEEALRKSEERLQSIISHSNELFFMHDTDHVLSYASPTTKDVLGYTPEEVMVKWTELVTDDPINLKGIEIAEAAIMTGKRQKPYLLELKKKDGALVLLEIDESPVKDSEGNIVGIAGAARDVTERKEAEEELKKTYDELERRVDERTRELSLANEKLQQEIEERMQAEETLQKKERELKHQADNLENINTALKVLLEHRDEEKTRLEENILLNVKKLILPYLDKLGGGAPNDHKKTYLNIIKSNLEVLVSPFSSSLSLRHLNLTPTEIQVADFVRHGHTNKEIASHLNVSTDAVSFHRKNIRKKLGLTNRKTNLRSYLQRLSA